MTIVTLPNQQYQIQTKSPELYRCGYQRGGDDCFVAVGLIRNGKLLKNYKKIDEYQQKNQIVCQHNILTNSMSDIQDQFQRFDAGSSDCRPTAAGSIKKGGYCMLKGFPCKVTDFSTAKPGKHGAAKAAIVGHDIFTNKKYEDTAPTSATLYVPNIQKLELEIADIDQDYFVSAIQGNGLKNDVKLPADDEELLTELSQMWEERDERLVFFTLLKACGQEKWISGRYKD